MKLLAALWLAALVCGCVLAYTCSARPRRWWSGGGRGGGANGDAMATESRMKLHEVLRGDLKAWRACWSAWSSRPGSSGR